MSAAARNFDLSKYRDLDVKSVSMRPVNGDDTLDAATRCIPPDGSGVDGNIFNLLIRQQIIAQSITGFTKTDGTKIVCSGPGIESVHWNARTREFVGAIFDHLNGVDASEREDFQKALASSSTPGSPGIASADKT